ncbi:hypothetical protein J6590_028112 [Homalodisca vitripennis]|nr:hypothetical protein J6590_028112 [Homalodisca vitripennis]
MAVFFFYTKDKKDVANRARWFVFVRKSACAPVALRTRIVFSILLSVRPFRRSLYRRHPPEEPRVSFVEERMTAHVDTTRLLERERCESYRLH